MALGICLGVIGALFQSVSYLFSRMCMMKTAMTPLRFLVLSHFTIAIFSAVLLLCVGEFSLPEGYGWLLYLIGGAVAYFGGQLSLIQALKKADPSRVSALLGLKVPVLALVSFLAMGSVYHYLQWVAIIMVLASAFFLSRAGGRLAKKDLMWIFLATLGYSISDIGATGLVKAFINEGAVRGPIIAVCFCYLLCGMITVVFILRDQAPSKRDIVQVLPYSITWFSSFLFLFASFASVGFVVGNIAQSSRGIISIILGLIITAVGLTKLEEKISNSVFLKRLMAGLVMLFAIGVFSYYK